MKKITLIAFLLFTTQLLCAQSAKFGIKAGLNRSFIDGGPLPTGVEGIPRYGFHVGVFKEFAFKNWSIMPSLLYSVKGFKVSVMPPATPPGVDKITGTRTFNYLEFPVNLLYNFKIKPGRIFVGAGPYMGYLLSASGNNTVTAGGTANYSETKFVVGGNGDYKRIDLGVNFVVGLGLKNGFLFNLAGYKGFTDILAPTATNKFPPMTKNGALTFSVGHTF
ncbi:MAG: PorT family protein [Sphingobacteriaceae bacterium]|nr:MAG: PorT family protein [Sphingobacteriaceae bacterium]